MSLNRVLPRGVVGVALTLFSMQSLAKYKVVDTYHSDHRDAVKIVNEVNFTAKTKNSRSLAEIYLRTNADRFGLLVDGQGKLQDLKLVQSKKSLIGEHFYFQQMVDGFEVDQAEIIVSVTEGRVYRVFNNLQPVSSGFVALKNKISTDEAYDRAWADLKVHGKMISTPKAKLKVVFVKGQPHLVYETELAVAKPFGYWRHFVDAQSGEVILREDTRITRKSVDQKMALNFKGKTWSRQAEFKKFFAQEKMKEKAKQKNQASLFSPAMNNRGTGEGLVFDPDPRTSLNDNTLTDTTEAGRFEEAYFKRSLPDLLLKDGEYTLSGPWVTIADFESPQTPPSKSSTGRWQARRGDNAFNDVMTYYHMDKNQRYMQSLGFKGDKGIQFGSIHVDSDGVNGTDNSHFVPSTNRVAFGHGCVDDNEDADVILHEYGHAIHFSINRNWRGGDTGAMGEGFGDYWAGSYSISTVNGKNFKVNEVFNWDGHGESNACWPGRRMDRLEARYDHSRTYGAHVRIEGGIQSDELWSTPIFQALLDLVADGHPREEIDRLILEAHFGLGSGIKMRAMAEAIIMTARRLYPSKPYADVFIAKFAHHKIIELPTARIEMAMAGVTGDGDNGRIDPGESVGLSLKLTNSGTANASGVMAHFSTASPGVNIANPRLVVGDLATGQTADLAESLNFNVEPSKTCGEKIVIKVALEWTGGAITRQELELELGTGEPIGILTERQHENGGLRIPDNKPENPAVSVLSVSGVDGALDASTLKVSVNVKHSYRGDLNVFLSAPDGKKVKLHGRSGGGSDNIEGVYPVSLQSAEPLAQLQGAPLSGDWTLSITDHAGSDTGSLQGWGLEAVTRYECE